MTEDAKCKKSCGQNIYNKMSRMQPSGGNTQNSETVEKTSVVVVAPSKFSNSIDLNDDFRRVMMRPAPSQAGSGPQVGPSKKVVIKVKMMIRNQTLGWPSQQNT